MPTISDRDCPHCKGRVWVNEGNPDDLSEPDVEAIKCPWCKKSFWINGKFKEIRKENDECEDVAHEGYKSPSEAVRQHHD